MKLIIFVLLFSSFAFQNSYGDFDLFNDLKQFVTKVKAGVSVTASEISHKFKPVTKAINKAKHSLLGGLNKGFFDVKKGVINGLDEVIGTPVDIKEVTFYLATQQNFDNLTVVDFLKPSVVVASKIYFIIHGWQSEHNASWCFDLTKAILDKYPESQVILVGWERPASENIAFSAFNTESVGYLVGILINRLVTDYNIPKSNFILIGHSLGGQIAGWAGKKFQAIRGEKLPRIVALDPAGPLFTFRPDSRRLNKDDADVVMVIHTNGGIMGFRDRCGTIDFFPNGGSCQPGCVRLNLQSIDALLDPYNSIELATLKTEEVSIMHHHLGKIVDDPRIRQVLIALGPFILTIVMGMSEAYSAIMLPQLQHPNSSIKIDRELASWIASMAALPMAAGSFSGGYLMDKIGRRAIHIWGSVPLILGWFVIAAADSSTFILIGRFLTGLSDGILGAPPNVYIAETSHPSIRGVLMISTSATVVFGILFVHVLGTFLSWKLTALICGLIPIPFVIFMCFTPESPTFLARKKKYEEASKAFLWCRGTSMESLKELDELLGRQRTINDASENNIMKQIKNLSQPEVWKPLVIICVFFFTAQISGNTVIAAYTIDILEECGLSGDVFNAYFAMIVMDVFRLISSIASLVFVKTMKRRTLALLSGYGVCASLFLLCGYSYIAPKMGISSTIFPMICLVCYVCFIAVGIQPLSWTMMGEIFPIAYRGVGTGLASLTCYLFFFAVVQTFPYLLVIFGNIFAVFIFYGICTGFGTVFLHVFLPETKDKPLHVIEDHFKSQKKEKQIISMVDINSVE